MSKIGDMKKRHNAEIVFKYLTPVLGLPVKPSRNIVFAQSKDAFIFFESKSAEEWIVPKSNVTDIALISKSALQNISEKFLDAAWLGGLLTGGLIGLFSERRSNILRRRRS